MSWNDLRKLIEGEAVVVVGKERVYTKMFYAEVDATGPLRLNRPLMLRPPAPGEIRKVVGRGDAVARHLRSGATTHKLHPEPSPTLDALIGQFRTRIADPNATSPGDCAWEAICAIGVAKDDTPALAPAVPLVSSMAHPNVVETEHTPMLEAASRLAQDRPMLSASKVAVPAEMARGLTEAEAAAGATPAEARARMNETMAIYHRAEADTPTFFLEPISPAEMRDNLNAVITVLEAISPRWLPRMEVAD